MILTRNRIVDREEAHEAEEEKYPSYKVILLLDALLGVTIPTLRRFQ